MFCHRPSWRSCAHRDRRPGLSALRIRHLQGDPGGVSRPFYSRPKTGPRGLLAVDRGHRQRALAASMLGASMTLIPSSARFGNAVICENRHQQDPQTIAMFRRKRRGCNTAIAAETTASVFSRSLCRVSAANRLGVARTRPWGYLREVIYREHTSRRVLSRAVLGSAGASSTS